MEGVLDVLGSYESLNNAKLAVLEMLNDLEEKQQVNEDLKIFKGKKAIIGQWEHISELDGTIYSIWPSKLK
jgi:hypothetical protein